MKDKSGNCWTNMPTSRMQHVLRNNRVKMGRRPSNPTDWQPGEQARLIAEALEAGKATKCKDGYTLDQGTLGLTEIKL